MLVDRDAPKGLALVIDANPMSRSLLADHLRSFGFGTVKTAQRMAEAREMLEHRRFDIVVCDDEIRPGGESGQDLLDELRREHLLPYTTVFVMVTSEATVTACVWAAPKGVNPVP